MGKGNSRSDRRFAKLVKFFEERLLSESEVIKKQAADRLTEITLARAEFEDRAAERRLRRELKLKEDKSVNVTEPSPVPVIDTGISSASETAAQYLARRAAEKAEKASQPQAATAQTGGN